MSPRLGLAALCALGSATAGLAQDLAPRKPAPEEFEKLDSHKPPPPSGLTGDWGGLRTRLSDAGVDIAASFVSETAWNFAGGERNRVREASQFVIGSTLDMGRLAGIEGGTLQATVTRRDGRDLGADAGLGVLQQVQEIFGRGNTWRLTQFWYEQNFGGGAVALKVGRATVGEDFASFSCYFMNLTFCGSTPGNLAGDYWYNWPISQWAARLRVKMGEGYVQAAVYEVNPKNLEKDFTIGHFHGATGVLVPVEVGWTPKVGPKGLIGSYKIGGWYSTEDAGDVLLDINHQPQTVTGLTPLERSGRYGMWLNAQQQISGTVVDGKPASGMSIFLNFTQTDRRTTVTDNQIVAGVFCKGIIPSLPKDVLAFAVGRTNVNGRVAEGERLDPTHPQVQHAEYAAELYYSLHPTSWLELRPNIQYIHQPGGYRGADDIGVLGLKAGLTL